MRSLVGIVAAGMLIVLTGAAPSALAASVHIHIQGFAFNPTPTTIGFGDTVTWDNHDGATHTTTDVRCPRAGGAGPCEWDSLNMGTGASFTHSFLVAGTFTYKCTIHGFTGQLTVPAPATGDLIVQNLQIVNVNTFTRQVVLTVLNQGGTAVGASTAQAEWVHGAHTHSIGTAAVPGLAAGASTTVPFTWDVTGKIGNFVVRGTADVGAAVAEASEANNVRSVTATILVGIPGIDVFDPV